MHGATWWLVAALLVVLALAALAMILWVSRTTTLSNRVGSFACAVADDHGGPWRAGIAQYGHQRMYWWRRASIAPRAAGIWHRAGIVVLERSTEPAPGGAPAFVVARCEVTTPSGRRTVRLRMSADAYAGFTSWIEATPRAVRTVI